MFKLLLVFVCLYIFNSQAEAKVLFVDPNAKHPDHPDLCYYKLTGHIFGVGQHHLPNGKQGGCFSYECQTPGVIATHGCDPDEIPQGCQRLRKDLYTPFPHCCERYLCENKKGELVVINPSLKSDWAKLN